MTKLQSLRIDSDPREDQLREIGARITSNLEAVHPLPASPYLILGLIAIVATDITVGTILLGTTRLHLESKIQIASVFIPLVSAIGLLCVAVVRQMMPGSLPAAGILASAGTAASLLVAGILSLFEHHTEASFVSVGLNCFRTGLLYAAPAAVLIGLMVNRGAVLWPISASTAGAALAGLAGLAILEIQCPNLNAWHVLCWHLGMVSFVALIGFAVGGILRDGG